MRVSLLGGWYNNNLFGTTTVGGDTVGQQNHPQGCGVLYEITAGGTFMKLHDFTCGTDGAAPVGVVSDTAGNLYGAAAQVVWKYAPATGSFSVIQTIPTSTGMGLQLGGVSPGGAIYGYLSQPPVGGRDYGQLFVLRPSGGTYTYQRLHRFLDNGAGETPSGLTVVGNEKLLGVTSYTGERHNNYGTIFSYDTGTFTTLYDFGPHSAGFMPNSAPTVSPSGAILGTTQLGGGCSAFKRRGCGVIYSFTP